MTNPLNHFIHTEKYDKDLATAKKFVQSKRKILHDNLSKNNWIVCSKCKGSGIIRNRKCVQCKGSGVRRVGQ